MKLARTNWVGVGVIVDAGANVVGHHMPWYQGLHWGWGFAMLATAGVVAWLVRQAEKTG